MAEETAPSFPSVRDLVEGDFGPLRKFRGRLMEAPETPKTINLPGGGTRSIMVVDLNFNEIDVIESIEPYVLPIYTISMNKSNRKKSKYGVFGDSLAAVLDAELTDAQKDKNSPEYIQPKDRADLKDCINKVLGMELTPDHILYDGRQQKEVPTYAWEVFEVEGVGGEGEQSPEDVAKEILDGKTAAQFSKDALANEDVRRSDDLIKRISMPLASPASFLKNVVDAGEFTKDKTGVYHRVA